MSVKESIEELRRMAECVAEIARSKTRPQPPMCFCACHGTPYEQDCSNPNCCAEPEV